MTATDVLFSILLTLLGLIAALFGWALRELWRLALAVSRLTAQLDTLSDKLDELDHAKHAEHRELREGQRRLARQLDQWTRSLPPPPARDLPPPRGGNVG